MFFFFFFTKSTNPEATPGAAGELRVWGELRCLGFLLTPPGSRGHRRGPGALGRDSAEGPIRQFREMARMVDELSASRYPAQLLRPPSPAAPRLLSYPRLPATLPAAGAQ